MRRLLAALLTVGVLTAGMVTASAAPPPAGAPPFLPNSQTVAAVTGSTPAQVSTPAVEGWHVLFGSGYGTHPVVSSSRNPAWLVEAGNIYWTFQADCNAPLYSTNGGGSFWATNTVSGLRPCVLDFQLNGDVQIRNAASQRGWHTNVIHSGKVWVEMALYDSGCLVEWYWNVPTQAWLNQWSSNLTNIGINCAAYTA